MKRLIRKARLALKYYDLVGIAIFSLDPATAYEAALGLDWHEDKASSCRALAIILQEYGMDKFDLMLQREAPQIYRDLCYCECHVQQYGIDDFWGNGFDVEDCDCDCCNHEECFHAAHFFEYYCPVCDYDYSEDEEDEDEEDEDEEDEDEEDEDEEDEDEEEQPEVCQLIVITRAHVPQTVPPQEVVPSKTDRSYEAEGSSSVDVVSVMAAGLGVFGLIGLAGVAVINSIFDDGSEEEKMRQESYQRAVDQVNANAEAARQREEQAVNQANMNRLQQAQVDGHDICFDCSTIDPDRCGNSHCQNCSPTCPGCGACGICSGFGSDECNICYDPGDDD